MKVEALSVRRGKNQALVDVSFEVAAGTSVALVGPNGSGKTTLLNSLAGLQVPTAGSVEVDRPVAFVLQHQDAGHWLPVTVREVIAIGTYRRLGLVGRAKARDRDLVAAAAGRAEVEHLLSRSLTDLSGGERQRALLAQALVQDAPTLLLDEPITGLDLASQKRILDVVDDEALAGRTVVMSTHHLDEARHVSTVVLLANRLVACGPPAEVLTEANLRAAYGSRVLGGTTILDDHGHGYGH